MLFLKSIEYPTVFFTGGTVYMLIEIMWRGYTHWSMGICAGVCFIGIYCFEKYKPHAHIMLKCLLGALFITLNEFLTGCIVNVLLGWNVWDYSNTPFNIFGQVCVLFTCIWFLLCFPAFWAAKRIKRLFPEKDAETESI